MRSRVSRVLVQAKAPSCSESKGRAMTDQDIKEILDIDVKEPPKTPQLTKEAIIGSLKVQE